MQFCLCSHCVHLKPGCVAPAVPLARQDAGQFVRGTIFVVPFHFLACATRSFLRAMQLPRPILCVNMVVVGCHPLWCYLLLHCWGKASILQHSKNHVFNSALIESIFILEHLESLELDLQKLLREVIHRSNRDRWHVNRQSCYALKNNQGAFGAGLTVSCSNGLNFLFLGEIQSTFWDAWSWELPWF